MRTNKKIFRVVAFTPQATKMASVKQKNLLFNWRNGVLSVVCLTIPTLFYIDLVDRRAKRRLPLVLRDELPTALAEPPKFAGTHPKFNYVEGWYADVPKKWFCNQPYMQEFARVFWLQNSVLNLEAGLLRALDMIGIQPYEKRGDVNCKKRVMAGKELLESTFHVEEVKENRVTASFWFTNPGKLLGGAHVLAVEENASQDKRMVRVWFVSHYALNVPSDKVEAAVKSPSTSLEDPILPLLNEGYFPKLLWFHRFYSRYLLDWTLGIMMRNCKEDEENQ